MRTVYVVVFGLKTGGVPPYMGDCGGGGCYCIMRP